MQNDRVVHVAAMLLRHGGNMLLGRRRHADFNNCWEFPGGKLEPGETIVQALQREIAEELQCTLKVSADPQIWTVKVQIKDFDVYVHLVQAEALEGTPRLLQHSEFQWLCAEDIMALPDEQCTISLKPFVSLLVGS